MTTQTPATLSTITATAAQIGEGYPTTRTATTPPGLTAAYQIAQALHNATANAAANLDHRAGPHARHIAAQLAAAYPAPHNDAAPYISHMLPKYGAAFTIARATADATPHPLTAAVWRLIAAECFKAVNPTLAIPSWFRALDAIRTAETTSTD